MMSRRSFFIGILGWLLVLFIGRKGFGRMDERRTRIEKIHRTEKQWREILTPAQFRVLRDEGTEKPFSSPLLKNEAPGLYVCAGCDLPLFTSEMKYDSRTGWPSFYTHIEGSLETKPDYKLIWERTEYHCARCEGHQGHLFDDGPPPTYERWCNNGVALKFVSGERAPTEKD